MLLAENGFGRCCRARGDGGLIAFCPGAWAVLGPCDGALMFDPNDGAAFGPGATSDPDDGVASDPDDGPGVGAASDDDDGVASADGGIVRAPGVGFDRLRQYDALGGRVQPRLRFLFLFCGPPSVSVAAGGPETCFCWGSRLEWRAPSEPPECLRLERRAPSGPPSSLLPAASMRAIWT